MKSASHLLFYKERLVNRLKGNQDTSTVQSNDETFISGNDQESWNALCQKIEAVHRELQNIIEEYTEENLSHVVNGTPVAKMISSIILHDAYHTGQIIQIRKLQGSWAASRAFL